MLIKRVKLLERKRIQCILDCIFL